MKELFHSQLGIAPPFEGAESLSSALLLDHAQKVDVLVTLLKVAHDNIATWTTRVYQAVTSAIAAHFAAASYIFGSSKVSTMGVWMAVAGLVVFGFFVQLYLRAATRAYRGNRVAIAKYEACLGLYDPGAYFTDFGLFVFSPKMLSSRSLSVLQSVHGTAVAISSVVLLLKDHFQ